MFAQLRNLTSFALKCIFLYNTATNLYLYVRSFKIQTTNFTRTVQATASIERKLSRKFNITGASDRDNDSFTFSLISNNAEAHRYFYVDKRTGVIYLRTSLRGVNQDTFTFKVKVSDNAYTGC